MNTLKAKIKLMKLRWENLNEKRTLLKINQLSHSTSTELQRKIAIKQLDSIAANLHKTTLDQGE